LSGQESPGVKYFTVEGLTSATLVVLDAGSHEVAWETGDALEVRGSCAGETGGGAGTAGVVCVEEIAFETDCSALGEVGGEEEVGSALGARGSVVEVDQAVVYCRVKSEEQ
jgi:hypothetical protein